MCRRPGDGMICHDCLQDYNKKAAPGPVVDSAILWAAGRAWEFALAEVDQVIAKARSVPAGDPGFSRPRLRRRR